MLWIIRIRHASKWHYLLTWLTIYQPTRRNIVYVVMCNNYLTKQSGNGLSVSWKYSSINMLKHTILIFFHLWHEARRLLLSYSGRRTTIAVTAVELCLCWQKCCTILVSPIACIGSLCLRLTTVLCLVVSGLAWLVCADPYGFQYHRQMSPY